MKISLSMMKFFVAALVVTGAQAEAPKRIVSVDGALTDIIYALGEEDRLVGVDTTSYYPQAATQLPKVGYKRSLSAEGILSLNPDVILATQEAGPPQVLQLLEEAGVNVIKIQEEPSVDNILSKIDQVGSLLEAKELSNNLVLDLTDQFRKAQEASAAVNEQVNVLFLFHAGAGSAPLVAGSNTEANTLIELAGGRNVVNQYEGYKPLNPEYIAQSNPDVIITTNSTIESLGGIEKLSDIQGLNSTDAVKNARIIHMDTLYLLGFGTRTPEVVMELVKKFSL